MLRYWSEAFEVTDSRAFSCCIDKTSTAELPEAINSMFRWYRDSTRCYVYLSDVHDLNELGG
jgi:hypothetical protein